MPHNINNKFVFDIFKKNRIIKEIVDCCRNEKIGNISPFILSQQQVVYKHRQNLSLT